MTRGFCDGLRRRDMLRIGGAAVAGLPLSLETLLAAEGRSDRARPAGRATSLIFLFLQGGLSTIDTFDMKPHAPTEFAGEFRPISTNVPGIGICEHLPRIAATAMDKFSLIRSFHHKSSDHGAADHYMQTGYFPRAGFNPGLTPNNHNPAFGSIIARALGVRGSVPAYICLPGPMKSGGAAYLGAAAAPFTIQADPSAPNFSVPDVLPPLSLPADRLEARAELLRTVDRFQQSAEARANAHAATVATFRERAFGLMTSPAAKQAFDIHAESGALRDAYGRNTLGQSCLMARRLVESGVRCVSIEHANWDTHDNNFKQLRGDLLPKLDAALATLFNDLEDRGLLASTLVLVTGEFGRTPRINAAAGRDHWGPAFTVALGGGGILGGRVEGSTDARAERPADSPHGPEDLAATMMRLLGINPDDEFLTPEGRPMKIVNNGTPIASLL